MKTDEDPCTFYVNLGEGPYIEWRGLSKRDAQHMYRITGKATPDAVTDFGWQTQHKPLPKTP